MCIDIIDPAELRIPIQYQLNWSSNLILAQFSVSMEGKLSVW